MITVAYVFYGCDMFRKIMKGSEKRMITINDFELPITVAEKIITGEEDNGEFAMFDVDGIKEIADYLMLYCNHCGEEVEKIDKVND